MADLRQGLDDIIQEVLTVVAHDVTEGEVQAAAPLLCCQLFPHLPMLGDAPQVAYITPITQNVSEPQT